MVTSTETRLAEGVYAHYTRAEHPRRRSLSFVSLACTGEAQDAGCIVGCTMRFVFVGANCIRPRPSATPDGVPPPHEWGG